MKIEWTNEVGRLQLELWVDDYYAANIRQLPDMSWVIFLWSIGESRWVLQEAVYTNIDEAKVVAVALGAMR